MAGSAAATLLARNGLTVALIERARDPAAHKAICTHYIQPSAVPTLRRLGLAERIEAAGGVRNAIDLYTRFGWARHPGEPAIPHGYNIRRERLDPLLRSVAAETDGVTLMLDRRAVGVVERDGSVAGVRVKPGSGPEQVILAKLVVAADGRTSSLASLAGVPGTRLPHRRFCYYAYFKDLPLRTGERSQLWFLDPQVAYAFPNDAGLTLLAFWAPKRELAQVKADTDRGLRRRFGSLPDGPVLEAGERVSPWLGKVSMPNVQRRTVWRGMALIGDAALASDPLWGVGIGWAVQSAEWLSDAVAHSLVAGRPFARGLDSYRRRHRRELLPHHLQIAEYSTGRPLLPPEWLLMGAAARDPDLATHVHRFAARMMPVWRFLSPLAIRRAAAVAIQRRARLEPQALPAPQTAAPSGA